MPLRIILQHTKNGRYNIVLQAGWFASVAKRIVRNQTLSEVEKTLFALENSSEIEIGGQFFPFDAASVPVIMTDMAVSNIGFGS